MEGIRAYILSVTAAAILCALVCTLAGKGNTLSTLIRLLSGIVLAAVVVSPLVDSSSINLKQFLHQLDLDAADAVNAGITISKEQTSVRIRDSLEAYILDKAEELSADISVELTLAEDTLEPIEVTLEGNISPFAKNELETMIRQDLGIPREAVKWK